MIKIFSIIMVFFLLAIGVNAYTLTMINNSGVSGQSIDTDTISLYVTPYLWSGSLENRSLFKINPSTNSLTLYDASSTGNLSRDADDGKGLKRYYKNPLSNAQFLYNSNKIYRYNDVLSAWVNVTGELISPYNYACYYRGMEGNDANQRVIVSTKCTDVNPLYVGSCIQGYSTSSATFSQKYGSCTSSFGGGSNDYYVPTIDRNSDSGTNLEWNNGEFKTSSYTPTVYNRTITSLYNGWYRYNNQLSYMISTNKDNIYVYYGQNTTAYSGLNNISSSCQDIYGLSSLKIYDIDCSSSTDCVAVGSYSDGGIYPLAFTFDGNTCGFIDIRAQYSVSNDVLMSVVYYASTNKYFAIGDEIFISLTTGGVTPPSQTSFVPPDFSIALSSTNSKTVINADGSQSVYVYPISEGSTLINGYYGVATVYDDNYMGVTCNYTQETVLQDTFRGYNDSTTAGYTGCTYLLGTYSASTTPSLFFNTSRPCFSAIYRHLFISQDAIVSYRFKPIDVSSNYTFDVRSGTYTSLVPITMQYTYDDDEVCFYGYFTAKTQIFCVPYTTSDDDILIELEISTHTHQYSLKAKPTSSDTVYSSSLPTYTNASNIAFIDITPLESYTYAYFDDIYAYDVELPSLDLKTATYNVGTSQWIWQEVCDYSAIGCYQTRFYYNNASNQVWNNFDDFNLCSVKKESKAVGGITGGETGGTSTDVIHQIFDDEQISMTTIFLILAIVFIVTILVVYTTTGSGMLGTILASSLTGILVVIFAVEGYFPTWVLAMLIVFIAGIIAIFLKSAIASG